MKVVAIFGEPGCGKTTLMRRVLCDLGFAKDSLLEDFKLVPYHKHENKYVLGKYEEGEVFAGTDRMSMAVQPEASFWTVYPLIQLFSLRVIVFALLLFLNIVTTNLNCIWFT
jgi:hypothetical protein